jgi:uncharacterized membrane protein YfcA
VFDAASYALLFVAGFVSSALNMVAGGGSFLTLPLLIFLGLPAGEANATNRVGVVAQNVVGVLGFHSHGVLDWDFARRAFLPCAVGALLGSWAVLHVGDRDLRRVLSIFMLVMTLFALLDPRRFRPAGAPARAALSFFGFLGVGLYGGFIQAGVGFLVLAVTSLLGLDLVRGNAVKVLLVLVQTGVSLAVFAWAGTVSWAPGLALAAGCCLGSLAGVKLTVLKGHRWLQRVVAATVVAFAVLLWLGA